MTRRTLQKPKSQALAEVHEASQTPVEINGTENVEHELLPVSDEYRHHLHIVARLDPGHALSTAETRIMEARGLKGPARRGKIAEAIHALRVADAQAAITAVAMLFALPAWIGVILKCAGVL